MNDEHAKKAAAILREGSPLDPAEQAAEKAIREGKWILWHAGDRDLGVIRLLHRAGLLRDPAEEKRKEESVASMRRLGERDRRADRALLGALAQIVTESVAALREGGDAGDLADRIEAAYRRAQDAAERTRRGEGRAA